MKAILIRNSYGNKQTLGTLIIFDGISVVYQCKTLELPWVNNERNISCIPEGDYWVRKRTAAESPSRDYDHFIVEKVPDRSYILWHAGTYFTHIKGCLLMGQYYNDINDDGQLDIMKTRHTIALLNRILPERFEFKVIS